MNCKKTGRLLGVWSDGELDATRAHELRQHLQNCADCREQERNLRSVAEAMRLEYRAEIPETLADRAFRAAMTAEPVATTFLDSLFPIAWPAALVGSMAAASLVILSLAYTPATDLEAVDPFNLVVATSSTEQVQGVLQGALGVAIDGEYSGGTP